MLSRILNFLAFSTISTLIVTSNGGLVVPASPVLVALYMTELRSKGCSYGAISSTVFSIKWVHSIKHLVDPTDNCYVKNLLDSAKRNFSRPVLKKESVGQELYYELCQKYCHSKDILIIKDLCIILLGFSAFLRYDEIKSLRCKDLVFYDDYFLLKIHKSTADQYRQGHEIVVAKGSTVACPYAMLLHYLELTEQTTEMDVFLFRPCFRSKATCKLISKNKPPSYTLARETVLMRFKEISPDTNSGLHSLRSGGDTLAANSGVLDRCWMIDEDIQNAQNL